MRSAGAARREQEPPPDAAAVIAGLGRVIAGSGEVHGRLRRHERRIASLAARMEACGDADLAALAGELRAALTATIVELISDAAHCAELREQAEELAPLVAFREMMTATLIAEGRRLEAVERDAAEAERARPVRHRHRKPGLTLVTGTAAAAAVVAASAGTVYVAHDSASVHPWAASRPAAARFHAGPPDSAVPASSLSPSARPSAAVASAHPAPVVTASPTPSSSPPPAPAPSVSPPPPPPQAAPSPSLLVSVRDLDLTGTSGTFTITAQDGPVNWWVSTDGIPGASVDVRQGVLSPGQDPVTITVTDPPGGEAGYVYVKWDGGGIASVWVTPSGGAPAVAMP